MVLVVQFNLLQWSNVKALLLEDRTPVTGRGPRASRQEMVCPRLLLHELNGL